MRRSGEKSRLLWKNGGFCSFNGKMGGCIGVRSKIGGLVEKGRFPGEIRVLVEKWGVFLKNGGFVGFWSINREKVGKGREFDDFLKIGENREK